jgi:hypothetical protein
MLRVSQVGIHQDRSRPHLPFAADISANLKNKVTKTNAQKVLGSLAGKYNFFPEQLNNDADVRIVPDISDKGLLTCKTYGKQSIYVYNQVSRLISCTSF